MGIWQGDKQWFTTLTATQKQPTSQKQKEKGAGASPNLPSPVTGPILAIFPFVNGYLGCKLPEEETSDSQNHILIPRAGLASLEENFYSTAL